MKYLLAEKFKSPQGEGVYAGTPMAFIRFVGCSVGKTICNWCDTDFEKPVTWRGGGEFTLDELFKWIDDYRHICLTGGEPLDQDLEPIFDRVRKLNEYRSFANEVQIHLETSGTKPFMQLLSPSENHWVCVSPKPGFIEPVVLSASEIKVIMPGLGKLQNGVPIPVIRNDTNSARERGLVETLHWPTLEDALRWAELGKTVFIQPKNDKYDIDAGNLRLCLDIIAQYPQLRISTQMHKILHVQ